jgi:formylglycine-generating enzyme required for sulfatase activity
MANRLRGLLFVVLIPGLSRPAAACTGISELPSDPVTIEGCLLCNWVTLPEPKSQLGPPPLGPEHVFAFYALDGTPDIRAEVQKLVADYFPEAGLDGDAAQAIQDQFTRRLKYFVSPESPALQDMYKTLHGYECHGNAYALTGRVSEKEGKKWITVSKYRSLSKLRYPDRMLAPDRPFAAAGKEPLILKVDESLAVRCVLLPPGKFLLGTPFYMVPRHLEEYPHMVTLTKSFYMSEAPVSQEVYQAVMGTNPSPRKDPRLPAQDVSCPEIRHFCRLLSKQTGRRVRLPTDAEWEYAARVGTSNPAFPEKYTAQNSWVSGRAFPLPIKSKQPNAWGLYDMASGWWEMVADQWRYNPSTAEVDPVYAPLSDEDSRPHSHRSRGLLTGRYSFGTIENLPADGKSYVGTKFRIVVEPE